MPSANGSVAADKSHWAISIVSGALVALAAFSLLLSAVAWFVPRSLRFLDSHPSRWDRSGPFILILLLSINNVAALVRYYLKRRGKQPV